MRTIVISTSVLTLVLATSVIDPGVGRAEEDWEAQRRAERRAESFQRLARELPVVAPEPGYEEAKPQAPPWCEGISPSESYAPDSIPRTLKSAVESDWYGFMKAAEITCHFPKEKEVHKAVAVIIQYYVN